MKRSVWWLIICFAFFTLGASTAALAGSGEIVDGKLNLSVTFTYFEEDPSSWMLVFEEASELLWNATNGQLQLGKVTVYPVPAQADEVDIWVLEDYSGAFANMLGLGAMGHIYISQTHKSTTEPAIGQFGIVHELGHYVMGLYDEYKGVAPPPFMAKTAEQMLPEPNQYCVTDADPVASIMDGGTTVPVTNQRTEFCTHAHEGLSTAHNDGNEVGGTLYINAQEALNGESCWQTIERILGLTPPDVVDTEVPPGLEPLEWEIVPITNRVVVCVDRSASMYTRPEKIALAKEGADLVVDLLHAQKTVMWDENEVTLPGEELAIVAFSNEASAEFPIQEILDEATRGAAAAAIEAMTPGLDYSILATNFGEALQTSLDEIVSQGETPAFGEAIIIFSDGGQNTGTDPSVVIPMLQERGIQVFTVGTLPNVDEGVLRMIAEETGGAFYLASSPEDLPEITTEIAAAVRAAGVIGNFEGIVTGLGESIAILIESFAEEVTFVLQWDESTLGMELTTPGGETITVEDALDREDVEAIVDDLMLYIRVVNPELGIWQAQIAPENPEEEIAYGLIVLTEDRSFEVLATTDQEEYDFPQPVHLRVDVIADVPVAGADVTATVHRPGADPVTITVFDDGDESHGDEWADDGSYNAIFYDFSADGIYTFEIVVVCEDCSGPDPNLPFVEDGGDPPDTVPPFTREAEVSVTVRGVSDVIEGDLDFYPKTLNMDNPNGNVTCYVELPEPYMAENIDVSTVLLNGVVSPNESPIEIGDYDEDDIQDLMLKFDRGEVIETLPEEAEAVVVMTGLLIGGEVFYAEDTISLIHIDPETPVAVESFPTLVNGTVSRINWKAFNAEPISYSGFLSVDGGLTWQAIFRDVEESAEYEWLVDAVPTDNARILIQVNSPEGVLRQGWSELFMIEGVATDIEDIGHATAFLGASPNPTRGIVAMQYSLAAGGDVRLDIYDVSGRLVRNLVAGQIVAGSYTVSWDGRDISGRLVSSGIYLYVFRAGAYESTGRLMLVR
jgi:hypothetical protein